MNAPVTTTTTSLSRRGMTLAGHAPKDFADFAQLQPEIVNRENRVFVGVEVLWKVGRD